MGPGLCENTHGLPMSHTNGKYVIKNHAAQIYWSVVHHDICFSFTTMVQAKVSSHVEANEHSPNFKCSKDDSVSKWTQQIASFTSDLDSNTIVGGVICHTIFFQSHYRHESCFSESTSACSTASIKQV